MCHYSKELSERASKVLFDAGDSTSRGLDVLNTFPPYLERAEGCRLFDIDGESYIDWMNAFGALPTGHAHPAVVEAAMQAMSTGAHYAAAIPQEIDLAELMLKLVLGWVRRLQSQLQRRREFSRVSAAVYAYM